MILNGIEYSSSYKEIIEASIPEPQDFVIATLDDGSFYIACQNCNRVKHFLLDPFETSTIVEGKRVIRSLNQHETPTYLCPHCGMNLFSYNIKKLKKYCSRMTTKQVKALGFDTSLLQEEVKRQGYVFCKCTHCHKRFKATRKDAKYCSNSCRHRATKNMIKTRVDTNVPVFQY